MSVRVEVEEVRWLPANGTMDVMGLFFAGRLKAIIDEVVPLKDGAAAQARLGEGKQFGKIVLTV